jgi:PAS domain S-box-containing protein
LFRGERLSVAAYWQDTGVTNCPFPQVATALGGCRLALQMAVQLEPTAHSEDSAYRAIFEASSDGLVINDAETGVVLAANPTFCQMHGYESMVGLHPTTFIHPASHHLFEQYVQVIREGREFRARAQDVRRDGTVFDVEVLGRGFGFQGRSALLGVVRDVTEDNRAYQLLEERVAARTSEIERRREVAEGLRDLVATINSKRTLDQILAEVLAQAGRLLGSHGGAIYLPLEENGQDLLGVAAATGVEPADLVERVPVGLPATGMAFARRRPVAVYDTAAALSSPDGIYSDQEEAEDRTSHLRVRRYWDGTAAVRRGFFSRFQQVATRYGAVLAVPLAVRDVTYGALTLYYRDPREFSHDEVWLAMAFGDQAALAIENARLHTAAAQRLHEQEALYRADQQMHKSLRLEEVLQALADAAAEILTPSATSVFMWDEAGERLVPSASRGLTTHQIASMTLAPGEGIIACLAQPGQPTIVEDVLADSGGGSRIGGLPGMRAGMYVPIILGEQVLGVFAVGYPSPRTFGVNEQRLLASLAQRAAVAIDNARLHGEAERRLHEVEALYSADEALHRSLELSEVLQALAEVATGVLAADNSSVCVWNDERTRLSVGAAAGFPPGIMTGVHFAPGEGVVGRVAMTGETIAVTDIFADPRATTRFAEKVGMRAGLCVPVTVGDSIFGVFTVGSSRMRTFSAGEQRLLLSLAKRAGLAIQNARLHGESEQRRKELEALYRADEALHRSLRLKHVVKALIDAATDLLHADGVGLWTREPERPHDLVPLASLGLSSDFLKESIDLNYDPRMRGLWSKYQTVVSEDASRDERLPPPLRAALEREGYRAFLSTRVSIGEEVFGAFSVGMRQTHAFTESERRLLSTLSNRAAQAIQNARLHEESEQRRQELEALYNADQALHRSLVVDEVLQTLVELAGTIFHSDAAGVWTLDPAAGRLTVRAAQGLSETFIQELNAITTLDEAPIVRDALGYEMQAVSDVVTDPRLSSRMRELVLSQGLHASFSVVIRTDEQTFGLFSVGFRAARSVTERERRLLTALGQRAAVAIRNARLYEQAQEAATLQERQRLARELHDAVTQTLFSTALIADVIPELWELDPREGRQQMAELQRLTRGALAEMRILLVELRPAALTELRLADLLRQLAEATAGRTHLEVSASVDGDERPLPGDVQVALYRIAQEALNNVVKHARARQASVTLAYEGDRGLRLRVIDDGCGFDTGAVPAGHFGLGTMRERAESIGAAIHVATALGGGTTLEVDVPRPRERAGD